VTRTSQATILLRGLEAVRLLRAAPISAADLAQLLGVSRDTVERILASIRTAGLGLASERQGRMIVYSLPAETLARTVP
jgi:DNA-binding transcriptional ArsR family regulator